MGDPTVRQDRYELGDKVKFVAQDPYVGSAIPDNYRAKWGAGPYLVEDVEDVRGGYRSVAHTQFVYINGERFSGYWFEPVRAVNK